MKITDKDRERYPHYTDSSIRGIRLVGRLPSKKLLGILEDRGDGFERLLKATGSTNPMWLQTRLADLALERGLISMEISGNLLERFVK